jgi:trimeric autotransporter adhesin
MTILHLRNSISRSPLRRGLLFIPLALCCFALSPMVQAVNPFPDGGYPNDNTAEGDFALDNLTTGTDNTAIGFNALVDNTDGSFNTANGSGALDRNTTGSNNTADGFQALFFNTGGSNTANGFKALFNNSADNNTANGASALFSNTTGSFNTATGFDALLSNTTGNGNTASGTFALYFNTTGSYNTASGYAALNDNTTGINNTATGLQALFSNTTGYSNTATGSQALYNNTTGFQNTANGVSSLLNNSTGGSNTANGWQALYSNTTGSSNIALGINAGFNLTTGSNNIDIGNVGVAGESKKIRIGTAGMQTAAFIAGIRGVAVTGAAVFVSSSGQLGVAPSSERFKQDIHSMDKTSEAILALKPVTFRYKHELDPEGIPQFGLVAEQVEKVNPDLVARDADGKVYTVRYEAVNAMLLNEFLKEHRTVQELKSTAAKQEATITQLKKDLRTTVTQLSVRLEEQDSKIERVSAQLGLNSPRRASQVVLNDQ